MTDLPLHLLDALSSREMQLRFIVGGAAAEYLVPDQVLGDAWHFCERATAQEVLSTLSEAQVSAVQNLAEALSAAFLAEERYDHSRLAALIDDPDWAAARQSAQDVLRVFGVTA